MGSFQGSQLHNTPHKEPTAAELSELPIPSLAEVHVGLGMNADHFQAAFQWPGLLTRHAKQLPSGRLKEAELNTDELIREIAGFGVAAGAEEAGELG